MADMGGFYDEPTCVLHSIGLLSHSISRLERSAFVAAGCSIEHSKGVHQMCGEVRIDTIRHRERT